MGKASLITSDEMTDELGEGCFYNPPIHEIIKDEIRKKENQLFARIVTEFHVDREELIKALRYDRDQYDKGWRDGYSLGYKQGKAEAIEAMKDYIKEKGKTDG